MKTKIIEITQHTDGTITTEDVTAREEAKHLEEFDSMFIPERKTVRTFLRDLFWEVAYTAYTLMFIGEWIWNRFDKPIMFAVLVLIGLVPIWLEEDATVLVFLLLFIGPLLLPESVQQWLMRVMPEWARTDEDDNDLM